MDTFSYTEEDGVRITPTIGGTRDFLAGPPQEANLRDLTRIKKKEIGLELHAITIAEYYMTKSIPCGLRCNLRPTLFADNLDFCTRFEKILNKASFDIILLILEQTQKELKEIRTEIQSLENNLYPTLT